MGTIIRRVTAGYGYQLTHGTCGIDDISIELYFEKGLGVAIGRWPFYLINKVINVAEYQPFWGDFITVLLLMLSAILWCALFRVVLKQEIPIACYIVFSVMFMDYSLITEVFVYYLQNGLGFVYLLSGLALWGTYYIFTYEVGIKQTIGIRIMIIACLIVAISFYESAANIYLSGVLLLFFIELLKKKSTVSVTWKRLFALLFFMVRFLLYAMIARRLIRSVLMKAFGIAPYYFYRSAFSIDWIYKGGIQGFLKNFGDLLAQIFCDYFVVGVAYFPVFLFALATCIFIGYVLWKSVRDKNGKLLVVGMLFYVSLYALTFIQGETTGYRACQIFTIFVALVLAAVTGKMLCSKRCVKVIGMAAIGVCLCWSIYDMIKWYELDYRKTEYEMTVIDEIANDSFVFCSPIPIKILPDSFMR